MLVAALWLSGCTSMQSVEKSPEFIQAEIEQGRILKPGVNAIIYTNKGKKVEMTITKVENNVVVGKAKQDGVEARIAIDEVVAVEAEQISYGKTGALVGGSWVVITAASLLSLLVALVA